MRCRAFWGTLRTLRMISVSRIDRLDRRPVEQAV
jgi:hypothetical protein